MPDILSRDQLAGRVRTVAAELGLDGGWLVGGAVRDLLLERPVLDWDVLVEGDPGAAARALANRAGGAPFPLSERHGAWRVCSAPAPSTSPASPAPSTRTCGGATSRSTRWPRGSTTARSPTPPAASPTSPRASCAPVSDRIFRDDPLRLLRLPRIAAELELEVSEEAASLAARDAQSASRGRRGAPARRAAAASSPCATPPTPSSWPTVWACCRWCCRR